MFTALHLARGRRDEWCRFEGLLVCLALVNQLSVLDFISSHLLVLPPLLLRAFAALVSLRALRLTQHAKELQDLISTILMSIPSLINVASLLVLILFIYSVLGVQARDDEQGALRASHSPRASTPPLPPPASPRSMHGAGVAPSHSLPLLGMPPGAVVHVSAPWHLPDR